jgi:hypothetical protein
MPGTARYFEYSESLAKMGDGSEGTGADFGVIAIVAARGRDNRNPAKTMHSTMCGTFALNHCPLRSILRRLGQVRRLDSFTSRQICDRACQFQDAVIGARREIQLAHRRADQVVTGFIEFAEFAHFSHTHIGVADYVCPREMLPLTLAGGLHPRADGYAGFSQSITAQFVIIDTRDFDMDVDPIQHRAGDAFLVFGDGGGITGAGFLRITKIAARAGIPAIERIFRVKRLEKR